MYPSKEFPHYGIFVKNTDQILKENNYIVSSIHINKTNSKIKKIFKYLVFFIKSVFKLNFSKYDLLYIHYPAFSAIPLLFSKKKGSIVIDIHGNDLVPENKKDEFFIKITNFAVKKSDYVFLPSDYFRKIFLKKYPNYDNDNIYIYPSGGVNRNIFKPIVSKEAKNNLKINANFDYVGFVSRIEKGKGWDIFLDSISILKNDYPDLRYLIVGSGSQENELERKIKEKGLSSYIIKFGYMNHSELVNAFNSMKVFCFPSVRKSESLGLVGLEAMACGVPVISVNGSGPESYIKDNVSGFLIDEMDGKRIAQKMKQVFSLSEVEFKNISGNASKMTLKYERNNVAKKFIKDINSIFKLGETL